MRDYTPIVGLEIHVELKTKSKMFCGCKNDPFHAPKPNIYTCPVCLGLPGALPVPNRKAVEWTIMLGLALGCEIQLDSKFDRKNYFYPDLPKGYQISQYDEPLARNGALVISIRQPAEGYPGGEAAKKELRSVRSLANARDDNVGDKKVIRIQRVHLEEDTGKLLHTMINGKKVTLIDFNRSGVPLVEIVTEPDVRSSDEAKHFLKKLHQIIRYLDISAADMEKGSMRLEPNISVAKVISKKDLPPYKVEVKNINSFNFVKKAIDYEVDRQIQILDRGEIPAQETRGWDEKKGITLPQRSKEQAHDYRYFPEPDIPPMRFTQLQITNYKLRIPELPDAKFNRFLADYHLTADQAERLTESRDMAEYFEDCSQLAVRSSQYKEITAKVIANWLINKQIDIQKITPEELLKQIQATKTVVQIDEKVLEAVVRKVLEANSKAISDYKSGKTNVMMFILGQVMKELKGKGNPQIVKEIIIRKLVSL